MASDKPSSTQSALAAIIVICAGLLLFFLPGRPAALAQHKPSTLAYPVMRKCERRTFATIVSGVRYFPNVLCLVRRIRMLLHVCPLIVIYDDRPNSSGTLTSANLRFLRGEFQGTATLLPLTALLMRGPRGNESVATSVVDHTTRELDRPPGRRLYLKEEWCAVWWGPNPIQTLLEGMYSNAGACDPGPSTS